MTTTALPRVRHRGGLTLSLPAFIDTPRLRVVAPDPSLAQGLTDALNASFALHREFLSWAKPHSTLKDISERLQQAREDFDREDREKKYYLLLRDDPAQVIGCIGIKPAADGAYELGYWVHKAHAGQGLMKEALAAVLAQLPGQPLRLTTSSANLASRKLAETVGFCCTQTHIAARYSETFGVSDHLVFEQPQVRCAQSLDAAGIAAVHVRSWQQAYRQVFSSEYLDGLGKSLAQRESYWLKSLEERAQDTFVAVLAGEVIGWISVGVSRDDDVGAERIGEVMAIYILAEHWGHGVGKRLWQAGLQSLARQGYETFTLWVLAENQQAIGFYRAAGLTEESHSGRTLVRGGAAVKEVRYRGVVPTQPPRTPIPQ